MALPGSCLAMFCIPYLRLLYITLKPKSGMDDPAVRDAFHLKSDAPGRRTAFILFRCPFVAAVVDIIVAAAGISRSRGCLVIAGAQRSNISIGGISDDLCAIAFE